MSTQRPFRVLGVQQIAVGGLDKARLRGFWVDTLGLDLVGSDPIEALPLLQPLPPLRAPEPTVP